jgi:hypothetical protein
LASGTEASGKYAWACLPAVIVPSLACIYDVSQLVYSKHEERIDMANSSKRFATVTENDLQKLLDEREAVFNTKRATWKFLPSI